MAENLTSFRMFLATCTGNAQNSIYGIPFDVTSVEDLEAACRKDHVCTEFQDNRRGSDNFVRCYAIQGDCDNDNTDVPAAWITPAAVAARLPGIAFYGVKSRNCDKVKHPGEPGEKTARPRWHYYFPLRVAIPDIHIIREIMARLLIVFPEFDRDGMKPAQFFFGHAEPTAEYHPGEKDIAEFFIEHPEIVAADPPEGDEQTAQPERLQVDHGSENEFISMNAPDMLAVIPADDYGTWIDIGMALKAAGQGVSLWDSWSQKSTKYPGHREIEKRWNSFRSNGKGPGTLVHYAKENGWKPDPDKLTGEAKRNHELKVYYEEQERKFREEHREEHAAKLAAIGIDCGGNPYRFTWKYDFDGSIDEVVNLETGEIAYQKSDEERAAARAAGNSLRPDPEQPVPGKTVYTVPGAKEPEKKNMLTIVNYNDIVIKETDYLFFPWFPRGKLVAVQGDSGTSKSTFAYAIGALVTTGTDLLGIPCEDPGNVMFITNEDDESDILTAFLDAGGDMSRLFRIMEREQIARLDLSPAGAAMINKIIKEQNIRFLVLDPIQAFLRGDMNKANETRPQLARLMDIAAENDNCIAFIEHTGKDTTKAALHRGIGSVDIGAATRSILQIVTDPSDDFYKIAYTVKNNTAALQDTRRAIRYQVMDRPGSRDQVTGKHHHFHGHAEFSEILPEYNERTYRRAQRNAEESSVQAEIDYATDPLVITVRKLIEQNPGGLFIGTTELIRRITICAGHCPYVQTQNKHNGINSRISVLRGLMMENDAIQMDLEKDPTTTKPFYWDGQIIAPDKAKERGVYINPIRNGSSDSQQTKF